MAMKGDDVAWEESERSERVWRHSLFEESTLRAIGRFIAKHRQGVPTELCEPKAGGFNALFRIKFIDGGSAVIRFTKPGSTMFPEEKIKQEVATMRYIQDNTTIPVPFVHHWGTREESPLNIGAFIILELLAPSHDQGPIKLWCDDLRPSNILLDANYQIVAVIDWEFSYAAPNKSTFAPPWWLLLEQPEYWKEGLDSWTEAYKNRLPVFLEAIAMCEDTAIAAGKLGELQRLSDKTGASWASGDFWAVYAARKNFAFDCVYWKELDGRFFGPVEGDPDRETDGPRGWGF
ncbi:phosphotransferase family protein [Cordyceps fumosorosea ARSEF 2679]|uniref:Phosphotransferase family protein n=1 Tax=Cordyceps fumosorosea (strain ARSEF 2679) TaxID=1081104 RepID=A0A162LPT3_CORFA|nr:phosphotransferase family protein [Cordyceps fumosorosea ARSEF 2679]OAA73874.1 phosphotransferase family protein [Cordyceps fumosorosea ARSEF 2679]